jgi:hypothetical protein
MSCGTQFNVSYVELNSKVAKTLMGSNMGGISETSKENPLQAGKPIKVNSRTNTHEQLKQGIAMCVVSMVMDHYDDWWKRNPPFQPPLQPIQPLSPITINYGEVSRAEFEELKKRVDEMISLLKRAKIYDESTNQPNCESEDKMTRLRDICKIVGIDLDEVLKNAQTPEQPGK